MADNSVFATPYERQKILGGVFRALGIKRTNFLQSFFTEAPPTNSDTVNFDQEYGSKNAVASFVIPTADVTPVKLPVFGHKEFRFAYSKGAIDSDSFADLNSRQMGQDFGQVNIEANAAARFAWKTAKVETRFENLFELCCASLLTYGGYQAVGEQFPLMIYDYNRGKATLASELKGADKLSLIPSVNLTASAVTFPWGGTALPVVVTDSGAPSYTQGEKAWTKALVTAGTAHPVEDITLAVQTCNERQTAKAIIISSDVYPVLEFDVTTNYATAADRTKDVSNTVKLVVTPQLETVKGLTFRRMWTFENGTELPIYTYNGVYHDPTTGVESKFLPAGWFFVLPDSGGIKVHGRIMHPDAGWQAMPRYLHYWKNGKTGLEEWEIHTSFLFGHTDIDAVVAWKVA
jgi:hypothetical protein